MESNGTKWQNWYIIFIRVSLYLSFFLYQCLRFLHLSSFYAAFSSLHHIDIAILLANDNLFVADNLPIVETANDIKSIATELCEQNALSVCSSSLYGVHISQRSVRIRTFCRCQYMCSPLIAHTFLHCLQKHPCWLQTFSSRIGASQTSKCSGVEVFIRMNAVHYYLLLLDILGRFFFFPFFIFLPILVTLYHYATE